MTNEQLENRLRQLIQSERRISAEILKLIHEAEKRRLYLQKGYSNAYYWLIKEFGYSQTAANRRITVGKAIVRFSRCRKKN